MTCGRTQIGGRSSRRRRESGLSQNVSGPPTASAMPSSTAGSPRADFSMRSRTPSHLDMGAWIAEEDNLAGPVHQRTVFNGPCVLVPVDSANADEVEPVS